MAGLDVGLVTEAGQQPGHSRITCPAAQANGTREHTTPARRHNPKILLAFPTNSPWQRWRENIDLQALSFYLPYTTVHPKIYTPKGWYFLAIKKSFKASKIYRLSVKILVLGEQLHDGTCYVRFPSTSLWVCDWEHTGDRARASPHLLSHTGFIRWVTISALVEWSELGLMTWMEVTRPRCETVLPWVI